MEGRALRLTGGVVTLTGVPGRGVPTGVSTLVFVVDADHCREKGGPRRLRSTLINAADADHRRSAVLEPGNGRRRPTPLTLIKNTERGVQRAGNATSISVSEVGPRRGS